MMSVVINYCSYIFPKTYGDKEISIVFDINFKDVLIVFFTQVPYEIDPGIFQSIFKHLYFDL